MNVKKQRATLFATLSIGELYQKQSKKEVFFKGIRKTKFLLFIEGQR